MPLWVDKEPHTPYNEFPGHCPNHFSFAHLSQHTSTSSMFMNPARQGQYDTHAFPFGRIMGIFEELANGPTQQFFCMVGLGLEYQGPAQMYQH